MATQFIKLNQVIVFVAIMYVWHMAELDLVWQHNLLGQIIVFVAIMYV